MEALDVASLLAEPAPLCWDRLTATNSPMAEAQADAKADAQADAQASPEDPLNLALPWLVRHLGVAEALAATLGDDNAGQPAGAAQVLPALRRIGFDARLVRCPIEQLRTVRLPAVLLLRCGDACVLTASRVLRSGQHLLQVVMPGQPPLAFEVPADEVAREYTGMALLVRPLSDQAGPAVAPASAAHRSQAPLTRLAQALEAARQAALAPAHPAAPGLDRPSLEGTRHGWHSRLRRALGAWRQWRHPGVRLWLRLLALAAPGPKHSASSLPASNRYLARPR